MTYQFARIDLSKTNYKPSIKWECLRSPDVDKLNQIYHDYCKYKRFASVMPIFNSRYTDPMTDVIGYYDGDVLVAFSLITRYNDENAECLQFAWDYNKPKMFLGLASLRNEAPFTFCLFHLEN